MKIITKKIDRRKILADQKKLILQKSFFTVFGAVDQFKCSIANDFVGTKNVGSVVQVIHDITDLKNKL